MILRQNAEKDIINEIFTIEEFIHLKTKGKETKTYYENILMDVYLYWGKDWEEWSVSESQGYLDYLIRVSTYKEIRQVILNKKVKIVVDFLNFLIDKNLMNSECIGPFKMYLSRQPKKKARGKREEKQENIPPAIQNFLRFLNRKEYANPSEYKKHLLPFQTFLKSNGKNIDLFLEDGQESTLFEYIKKFEDLIARRVTREEITLATGTIYLRAIQLFIKFLANEGLVRKEYTLPIQLRGRAKRANEYVPKERIIELMNAIYENSNHVLRDLSIFLIILDTGCRPIEVSNLTIEDINVVERTLSFECSKTEKRKIKISHEVMEVIKDYLNIRGEYNPDTEYLFVTVYGNQISKSCIKTIFYTANLKAFGESLYPAKAFRHTYITNALEEYSFERVSRIIGHKDWKSTFYYYHRSKKRLLTNTLDKSPLIEMRNSICQ